MRKATSPPPRSEYAAAAAQRDPKKPLLQFNAGTAAYRAGQFPQAAQAFQASISHAVSGDPETSRRSNRTPTTTSATPCTAPGRRPRRSAPQQTLETWAQAVKAYDTALELRADDADSKFNRDFVKRKINELKQQQNQNPQQNPQTEPATESEQPAKPESAAAAEQPPPATTAAAGQQAAEAQPPPGQPPPPSGPAAARSAGRRPVNNRRRTTTSRPTTAGATTATERRPAAARPAQARAR